MFAWSVIRLLEEITGFQRLFQFSFSPVWQGQGLINLTATNKQVLLLMYVKYQMILPYHDYVITKQHILVSSVIDAGCFILETEMLNIYDPPCITICLIWKRLESFPNSRKVSKIQ